MQEREEVWSLAGRTCVVTGATSGIGLETALGLARRGARVVMVGRDPERSHRARADVVARSGNDDVELLLADFASLAAVRRLAEALVQRCAALHVLVNNAGVVNLRRQLTRDGFESTLAVNHLAPFLLTGLLRERLVSSAPARIVNVASKAHQFGPLDLDDLQSERRYAAMRVYGMTKLANILFTYELARRLEGSGVTANCLHPGGVATRIGRNNGWIATLVTFAIRPFMLSPEQGAETSIHLASCPELAGVNGRYFSKRREARTSPESYDRGLAAGLWERSDALLASRGGSPWSA